MAVTQVQFGPHTIAVQRRLELERRLQLVPGSLLWEPCRLLIAFQALVYAQSSTENAELSSLGIQVCQGIHECPGKP